MEDYKLIFEKYQTIKEAGFSMARADKGTEQQPWPQPKFKRPSNKPLKLSTAPRTDMLPTSPGSKISMAGVSGGASIDEEEIDIKGYGKMSKKNVHGLYDKVMKDVHALKAKGATTLLPQKLELLKTLSQHL